MTVYVYKFEGQLLAEVAYRDPWYGLTADTGDELRIFAESLGLRQDLYRPVRARGLEVPLVGHYDLVAREYDRAVENGAKLITTREHKKMLSEQAAAIGIRKLD